MLKFLTIKIKEHILNKTEMKLFSFKKKARRLHKAILIASVAMISLYFCFFYNYDVVEAIPRYIGAAMCYILLTGGYQLLFFILKPVDSLIESKIK